MSHHQFTNFAIKTLKPDLHKVETVCANFQIASTTESEDRGLKFHL